VQGKALAFALLAGVTACAERPLEIPESCDGPSCVALDLHVPTIDLAMRDLFGADLTPGDMARPIYCDGIYVIDGDTQGLAFFDPVKLTFTDVASPMCPVGGGVSPFSMALGRDGTAWVEYTDGHMFRVDSQTGACASTMFQPNQHGFDTFGMGFSTDTPGGTAETLFIADFSAGAGLASIDLQTLLVHPIAPLSRPSGAELTGTGDAELWGFFGDIVAHAGRIDKQTGVVAPDFALPALGDVSQDGYAWGFFGGSFYVFTYGPNESTTVTRIDRTDGSTQTLLTNTGRHVVGAGVSTCAPTTVD
jgi:hypothetical protein